MNRRFAPERIANENETTKSLAHLPLTLRTNNIIANNQLLPETTTTTTIGDAGIGAATGAGTGTNQTLFANSLLKQQASAGATTIHQPPPTKKFLWNTSASEVPTGSPFRNRSMRSVGAGRYQGNEDSLDTSTRSPPVIDVDDDNQLTGRKNKAAPETHKEEKAPGRHR
mmetsp:Transcript_14348/g.21882  ORF Transcript_14348/g.21882 Transcript_14348/m.21882 type:complete len:169 (-) Transcript_14348:110-616(-)